MFVTVYVDVETFNTLVINGYDFHATITPGEGEESEVTLSVPVVAVYTTDDDEIVLVKQEVAKRFN